MVKDFGFTATYLVIDSWEALKRIPNYKKVAGCALFRRIFQNCPEMKPLFGFPIEANIDSDAFSKSRKFVSHAEYFIDMLDRSLNMLGPDIELLTEIMHDLGKRHVKYGVKADMYPIMGEALIHVLKDNLREEQFSSKMEEAWKDLYADLTKDMMLYAE